MNYRASRSMNSQYTTGLDNGTNSVRALLAEAAADQEAGTVSGGSFLLVGVLNPRVRIMRGQHYGASVISSWSGE
jgi:hypothetical protein